jgi:hypothetical protein
MPRLPPGGGPARRFARFEGLRKVFFSPSLLWGEDGVRGQSGDCASSKPAILKAGPSMGSREHPPLFPALSREGEGVKRGYSSAPGSIPGNSTSV